MYASVSVTDASTFLAASLNFISRSLATTTRAFFSGRSLLLFGMDGLEQGRHGFALAIRDYREDIAVEVNRVALVPSVRIHHVNGFQQT